MTSYYTGLCTGLPSYISLVLPPCDITVKATAYLDPPLPCNTDKILPVLTPSHFSYIFPS